MTFLNPKMVSPHPKCSSELKAALRGVVCIGKGLCFDIVLELPHVVMPFKVTITF